MEFHPQENKENNPAGEQEEQFNLTDAIREIQRDKKLNPKDYQRQTDAEEKSYIQIQTEQHPLPASEEKKSSGKKKRKKKLVKRSVWSGIVITLLVIALAGWLAIFAIDTFQEMFGIERESNPVEVEIPQGSSASEIADILADNGVITKPLIFRLYAKLRGADDKFQYGLFFLNSDMSYDAINEALQVPVPRDDVVDVTIPEGLTAREIAELLEENGVCSESAFIESLNNDSFGFDFEEEIPKSPYRYYLLEGYLFPNTYQFYLDEPVESVIKRMLSEFESNLTSSIYTKMEEMDLTLDELITFASIIQKESSDPEYMAMVSSVFHNRRNSSAYPKMQSDPTYQYVEKSIVPYLRVSTQKEVEEYYAAYNTYECDGLPVGPICSPGIQAIEAVLNPAESPYYYFVTDKFGEFYFAETLEEHEQNIRNVEKINKQS